jgi:membrane associated rhomboid family serine protease
MNIIERLSSSINRFWIDSTSTNYGNIFKDRLTLTNGIATACLAAYALTHATRGALLEMGALNISKVLQGQVWRIFTYPFLHKNVFHLAGNLYSLNSVGPYFENYYGTLKYAKVVTLAIISNVIVQSIFDPSGQIGSIGFSGALFGLVGVTHVMKMKNEGFKISLKASVKFICTNAILEILVENVSGLKIDHLAHISGYVAGLVFGWISK